MPSSPSSLPCDNGPTVRTGVGDMCPAVSTVRTRPDCSATNMFVSRGRHASATGLSRLLTTATRPTRTRARSGIAGVVVDPEDDEDDGARAVVVVVGSGLVGGTGTVAAEPLDDPLLHAASR